MHGSMQRSLCACALFSVALLSGCSTRTAYLSGQEMQRQQCDKLTDMQQMQHCRADARLSFEDYQRQQEALKPAQ
jgi:hypothetical protein